MILSYKNWYTQLIYTTNQMIGFYKMGKLAINKLISDRIHEICQFLGIC